MGNEELAVAMTDQGSHIVAGHKAGGDEVARQLLVAQLVDKPEEDLSRDPLKPSAPPPLLDTIDDIAISVLQATPEQVKEFRLLLKVAVDKEDIVS